MDGGGRHTRDWDPGNPNTPRPESSSRRRRRRLPLAPTTDVDSFTSSALSGAGADPSVDSSFLEEWTSRRRDVALGLARARELALRRRPSSTRWQASSSAAPPSDHSGTEGAVTRTRMRQSVMYSNRPRRPRRRQEPLPTQDHPSEVDSSELGGTVTDLPPLEALSLSDPQPSTRRQASSSAAPPVETQDHPSEVDSSELGGTVTDLPPLEALSLSDPQSSTRRQASSSAAPPVETEEYPSEASITELGRAVTDLPTLEALSLRESPLLTPQRIGEESEDEDDTSSHIYVSRDVGATLYSGSRMGLIRSLPHSDTLAEELQRPDSDEEPEETQDQIQRLLDAHPPCTIRELFDSMLAAQHAALTALAAEHGTERPRDPLLVGEESQLAPQHASAEAAQPLPSMTPSHKTSTEENIEDGKKWMRDEVKLCFKKHIEKTPHHTLTGVEFELAELCHQCFNVESYTKVFHHYNFKMRMKMPNSSQWTMELYFAEVKEIFGRKFYFCCPLEPNESGHCNACKNQGMDDLKHPVTGGFEVGLPDAPKSNFWCLDEDEW